MATASVARDAALEELYRTPPATFTRTRDTLARRLKDEGETEAAEELKKLRRPPVVAYVLNQLSRAHADDVAELVDVGRELARAQRKALRGEATTGLREAIARQREVVSALTSKTVALMRKLDVPPKTHLDEIAGALQAALVDPAVGEKLEEGRLEAVPEATAGFGEAMPRLTSMRTPPRMETRAQLLAEKRAAKEAGRRERRRVAEEARAEKHALALAKAGEAAAALAGEADAAEERATARLAEARELAKRAREAAADAKRLAAEAKRTRSAATKAAKRTSALRRS